MRPYSIWEKIPEATPEMIALIAQGISYHNVARALSEKYGHEFTADQIRSKLRRKRTKVLSDRHTRMNNPAPSMEGRVVTLVISDLHEPFSLPTIYDIVHDDFPEAKRLVDAGDSMDCYSVSKFNKDKDIAVTEEMKLYRAKLKGWASRFERIDGIESNHLARIEDYIHSQIDPRLQFLVDAKLLHRFRDGWRVPRDNGKDEVFDRIPNYYPHDSWWMQIGDAIIAHPKTFSAVPMKTVHMADDYFNSRGIEHKVIIIGHTHHAGTAWYNNHLLVECGCCCGPLDYSEKGNLRYKIKNTNAVFVLVQYDGVTAVNECRLVRLGEGDYHDRG